MPSDEHGRLVYQFAKNWAAIWANFFKKITPPVGGVVVLSIGGTLLFIYTLLPMIVYQTYFFGFESFTDSGDPLTEWDGAIILALEVVWVALNITVPLAAHKTLYGDSDA